MARTTRRPFKKLSELPDILTLEETADLLRVSKLTIKRWEKARKIKAIRINSRGDRRFFKTEVERIIGI